jgi:hypothetical protein
MKTIMRRLSRLERPTTPELDRRIWEAANTLWERRRRRLEASGQPCVEAPPEPIPLGAKRMSNPETLRLALRLKRERASLGRPVLERVF